MKPSTREKWRDWTSATFLQIDLSKQLTYGFEAIEPETLQQCWPLTLVQDASKAEQPPLQPEDKKKQTSAGNF